MTKIRLAVFDIDGVLKEREKDISNEMILAIEKLQSKGILCTIATGRGYLTAVKVIRGFTPNSHMIVEDGGRITDIKGRNLITMKVDNTVISKFKIVVGENKENIFYSCYCDEDHWYNFVAFSNEAERHIRRSLSHIAKKITRDFAEFIEWLHEGNCAKIAIKAANEKKISFRLGIEGSFNEGLYNINPKGVNKGSAVAWLAQHLDIPLEEVLVAGNDYNDIPMLRLPVGIRVAVGEGVDELARLANITISSPSQLSKFIQNLY